MSKSMGLRWQLDDADAWIRDTIKEIRVDCCQGEEVKDEENANYVDLELQWDSKQGH